jgi:S1-C subfamily serine protease
MELSVVLNHKRPGDNITVTVYRAGKKMDIPVKLGERTDNQRQQ